MMDIIVIILMGVLITGFSVYLIYTDKLSVKSVIMALIGIILIIFGVIGCSKSNSTQRFIKDVVSDYSAFDRTIIITAEDGREIYNYSGKVDIEIEDRKIKFEDENGKRQIIIFGITDTVTIIEN